MSYFIDRSKKNEKHAKSIDSYQRDSKTTTEKRVKLISIRMSTLKKMVLSLFVDICNYIRRNYYKSYADLMYYVSHILLLCV